MHNDQLKQVREALQANHQWHQDYDDHGGYDGSELCNQNIAALAALSAAPETVQEQPEESLTDWLITEISAIDCRYRGDPSYDHDAYWMKERVTKLIEKSRSIIDAAAPVQPASKPLKDHVIREAINRLTQVARDFHATQQLRQRIAGIVLDLTRCDTSSKEASAEICAECNVRYPYHDLDCKTGRERGKEASEAAREPIAQAVIDAHRHYERFGAICEFEGQPMIYAATLGELAEKAGAAQPAPARGWAQQEVQNALVSLRDMAKEEGDSLKLRIAQDALDALQSQPAPEAGKAGEERDTQEAAELQSLLMTEFAAYRPTHPAGLYAWAKIALLDNSPHRMTAPEAAPMPAQAVTLTDVDILQAAQEAESVLPLMLRDEIKAGDYQAEVIKIGLAIERRLLGSAKTGDKA